jgi:hypothetical protein
VVDTRALGHPPEQGLVAPSGKLLFRPLDEGAVHVVAWTAVPIALMWAVAKFNLLAFLERRSGCAVLIRPVEADGCFSATRASARRHEF